MRLDNRVYVVVDILYIYVSREVLKNVLVILLLIKLVMDWCRYIGNFMVGICGGIGERTFVD